MSEASQLKNATLDHAEVMMCIDPGVHTGFAVWQGGRLVRCETGRACQVERAILEYAPASAHVLFEDARLRTWFGSKGREALQGAGSIKRDCSRWQEWLEHHGYSYTAMPPQKGGTKWPPELFARLTGWEGRTSEHARDAAALGWRWGAK